MSVESARRWAKANRELINTRRRADLRANPEAVRRKRADAARAWRAGHKEHVRAYQRARRALDPDAARQQERIWGARRRARQGDALADYNRKRNGLPAPSRPEPDACECCGGPPGPRYTRLSLDHCPSTGKFRGWLCHNCNLGIGRLGDSAAALKRALAYLSRAGDV